MGKKPLNEQQVKTLRKIVSDKPLHELLLNLSVDLMLRSSDLLSLRVKDVINESGSVKTEVKVKQKKTGKTTLSIPLSKNSIDAIKKHLVDKEQDDYIFKGQMGHFMRKPICSQQYELLSKVVFELKIKRQSGFQESLDSIRELYTFNHLCQVIKAT